MKLDDVVGAEVLAGVERVEAGASEADERVSLEGARRQARVGEVDVDGLGEAGGEELPVGGIDGACVVDDALADGDAVLQTADAAARSVVMRGPFGRCGGMEIK